MQKIEYTPERCEELMKCMDDPVYFIETYVIRDQMTPFQLEIVNGLRNGHVIAKGPRRNGKTTVMWAYMLWYATFKYDRTIAMAYSKSVKQEHVRAEFNAAFESLPYWMRPEIHRTNRDYIEFGNGNRIIYRLASGNAFRGMTISLAVFPDFPSIDSRTQEDMWCSFAPCIPTGGTCLMMHDGSPGDGTIFNSIWESAASGQNNFVAVHDRWEPN